MSVIVKNPKLKYNSHLIVFVVLVVIASFIAYKYYPLMSTYKIIFKDEQKQPLNTNNILKQDKFERDSSLKPEPVVIESPPGGKMTTITKDPLMTTEQTIKEATHTQNQSQNYIQSDQNIVDKHQMLFIINTLITKFLLNRPYYSELRFINSLSFSSQFLPTINHLNEYYEKYVINSDYKKTNRIFPLTSDFKGKIMSNFIQIDEISQEEQKREELYDILVNELVILQAYVHSREFIESVK